MTTTSDIPGGERLAKVEAAVESLVREMAEVRADLRNLNAKVDRNLLWTLGIMMTMWVTIIAAIFLKP